MEAVTSKVPSDMKEQIDDYAREIGETRSIAMRKLLRAGLESRRPSLSVHHVVAWIGSLFVATTLSPTSPTLALYLLILGLLLFAGGLSWPYLAPAVRERLRSLSIERFRPS